MKNKRIFAFDFIRVLAMIMIVVFHYNAYCIDFSVQSAPVLFIQYANGTMGHIGVSLFFILSGASLMYSYGRKLELKTYFKKRFLSIYPLYWITYAAFFTHFYIINRFPMQISRKTLLLTLFGMDGYLYYKIPNYYLVGEWFVGCIVILYLLFPLLRRCVLKAPVATAVVTAALYIPYLAFYPLQMEEQRFFLSRIPELLFGMYMVAYGYRACGALAGSPRPISWKAGLPALAAFLYILFVPVQLPQLYLIMWTGASGFVALAWISQFLEFPWLTKPFQTVSACSFAIFLVHHVLMSRFIVPVSGMNLDFWQNHILFFKYFIFTCVTGFLFYFLSQIGVKLLSPLLDRL